jgi:hypothetical protein
MAVSARLGPILLNFCPRLGVEMWVFLLASPRAPARVSRAHFALRTARTASNFHFALSRALLPPGGGVISQRFLRFSLGVLCKDVNLGLELALACGPAALCAWAQPVRLPCWHPCSPSSQRFSSQQVSSQRVSSWPCPSWRCPLSLPSLGPPVFRTVTHCSPEPMGPTHALACEDRSPCACLSVLAFCFHLAKQEKRRLEVHSDAVQLL